MNIEAYLSKFYNNAKDLKLIAMKYFMNKFNSPEKNLKFIHIAGTNGKGSCAEMLTNIFIKSGYKVGKFISPHLIKYNERISINNENITDEELERIIKKINPIIKDFEKEYNMSLSFFSLITIIAILYFKENNCDFVVLETGLGGLLDSTNIVNPIVSIISSIGLDHMHMLGNTLEEIAKQKAGIIKEKSETIYVEQSEDNVNNIIKNTCKSKNNKLHLIKEENIKNYSYNEKYQKFDYKDYKNILINLKGKKQIFNASICLECASILKNKHYEIKDESLREALKTVVHKARFETISKMPLVIYDGAHNKPAIENLINTINMYYKEDNKVLVISILKRKDYKSILKVLLENTKGIYIFTDGNNKEKYVSKEELLNISKSLSNQNELYALELNEAINLIKNKYEKYVSFIIGSFYIYKDVLEQINDKDK